MPERFLQHIYFVTIVFNLSLYDFCRRGCLICGSVLILVDCIVYSTCTCTCIRNYVGCAVVESVAVVVLFSIIITFCFCFCFQFFSSLAFVGVFQLLNVTFGVMPDYGFHGFYFLLSYVAQIGVSRSRNIYHYAMKRIHFYNFKRIFIDFCFSYVNFFLFRIQTKFRAININFIKKSKDRFLFLSLQQQIMAGNDNSISKLELKKKII